MKVTIEQVAAICHEVNRAYVKAVEGKEVEPWHLAPQWQKDSAIDGVKYAAEHPDNTPEKMHERWMEYRLSAGWVYGETKDDEKKTHPCLVPYDELPETQKAKDYLFDAVVKAAMNYLNCDFAPPDGSMLEHLYAGSVVITGDWLPYKVLDEMGIHVVKVGHVSEVGEALAHTIKNLDELRRKNEVSRLKIYEFASWAHIIDSWIRLYQKGGEK